MSRDNTLLVDDIWECASKVQRYSAGMARESFFDDEKTYDAVLRNLEIIGEAAKSLPEILRSQIVGVEWSKVVGMRNYVAHVYFGISEDIVWDVITARIPELLAAIGEFRQRQNPSEDAGSNAAPC